MNLKNKKIRWIRQKDKYSCVPIAFLNIFKWLGYDISYQRDFKKWCRKLKYDQGCSKDDYEPILYRIPDIKIIKRVPTTEMIDNALLEGKAVLVRSMWKNDGDDINYKYDVYRHVFLITKRTKKSFFLTNAYLGHGWSPKLFVELYYLEKHKYLNSTFPLAWFLEKR